MLTVKAVMPGLSEDSPFIGFVKVTFPLKIMSSEDVLTPLSFFVVQRVLSLTP